MMDQPPVVKCTECYKTMKPVWVNGLLDGWACDCTNTEKAILRERQYREDDYVDQKGLS